MLSLSFLRFYLKLSAKSFIYIKVYDSYSHLITFYNLSNSKKSVAPNLKSL